MLDDRRAMYDGFNESAVEGAVNGGIAGLVAVGFRANDSQADD
jgi:hypothetical protein